MMGLTTNAENRKKQKEAYIDAQIEKAKQYEQDVLSGKKIASQWIKKAVVRRERLADKYFFSEDKAREAFGFFYYVKIVIGAKPERFVPLDWMAWITYNIYGLYRDETCRKKLFRFSNIWVARKSAKALSLDTRIPTPSGWTTMGEISVGDEIFSVDGSVTRVTGVSEISYHRKLYEVEFEDGEKIKACEDHLWEVETRDSRRRVRGKKDPSVDFESGYFKDGFVLTTKDMLHDVYRDRADEKGREYKYRVPVAKPLELPEKDLPVDPYLLGCWLGGGDSSCARISSSVDDIDMYKFLENDGRYSVSYSRDKRNKSIHINISTKETCFKSELRDLGLLNNKHIPKDYLRASREQRLALLQGLMDTDGTVSLNGKCVFTQKSASVSHGVSELLSSLGIKHSIKMKEGKIGDVSYGNFFYILFFTDKTLPCFRLERKFNRLKDRLSSRMKNKSIVSIKEIPVEPMRCISVDHESKLYLSGDRMTATHNTTYASVLALYALTKGEYDAEVYFCATTKDQASQALRYLKSMVGVSPALNKRVKRQQYRLKYESDERGSCIARPVANEPDTLDGLKPSFAIVDEKHALPDNDLFNIMKTGMLACEDPQIVTISTAGFNRDYPFYKELELGKKVLDEELDDDSTFYAFYTLDDESEIGDPEMWIKSNPSLKDENGIGTMWLDDLVVDYKKACMTLVDKNNFITKNLNVYTDSVDSWIPDAAYKKCFNEVDVESLRGCDAYMGIDLSRTRDLASLVVVVKDPETGRMKVIPEFFFPTEAGENKIRESGIDLTEWIDAGWIQPHYGNIIDYNEVFERIKYYSEYFNLISCGYDSWFAAQLIAMVESEIMLDMIPLKQNTGTFTFPMKYFERLVFSEDIDCSKSPVLRWNIRNCVPYYGGNDDCKLMKNKSLDSIDGAVALLMALAVYANDNFDALNMIMNGE